VLAMKSSNLALSMPRYQPHINSRMKDAHSGCHLDKAGRFSMTSLRDQVILAISRSYPESFQLCANRTKGELTELVSLSGQTT